MELRIYDSERVLDESFGNWLIPHIRVKLLSNISKYNLSNFDKFLNDSSQLTRLYSKNYKTSEIIIFAADCLVCRGVEGEISIQFENKNVPGFDRVKLLPLIKTINYGTLAIKGCNIFIDIFEFFSNSIDDYVAMYYNV